MIFWRMLGDCSANLRSLWPSVSSVIWVPGTFVLNSFCPQFRVDRVDLDVTSNGMEHNPGAEHYPEKRRVWLRAEGFKGA
jgi:hypothetical protein